VERHDGVVLSIIFTGYREYESLLQTVLEGCICSSASQYNRCVIEVVLQTINDDGSALSCALHATVAALMDAGICMKRLPLATTISLPSQEEELLLLLDPNREEEQRQSTLTIITSNVEPDRILGTMGDGKVSLEQLLACQEAASRASPAVLAFLKTRS
jgi:exosome complex component RRP46